MASIVSSPDNSAPAARIDFPNVNKREVMDEKGANIGKTGQPVPGHFHDGDFYPLSAGHGQDDFCRNNPRCRPCRRIPCRRACRSGA
ncbi:hypothetical protein DESC_370192 [Desulfosarcina cetonica]|nr:hypothetical protein DESC_370192 [Desulfosarcina cetonica]